MQRYWCVNCGWHGDFGYERKRGLQCENCSYEHIIPISKTEFNRGYKQNKYKEQSHGSKNQTPGNQN